MADDLERASILDVNEESTDDKHPIDIDVRLFGAGSTEAIVADLEGERLADDDQQETPRPRSAGSGRTRDDEDGAPTRVGDADPGVEPIGGYRANWHPSGQESDTFDPTDLRVDPDVSYGAGAIDASLRIADNVKYADDADPPVDGDPPADTSPVVIIGGDVEEPTYVDLDDTEPPTEPPDSGAGTVTEVSDTDAPLAALDSTRFEDVD
jgi:hypothetical protein